MKSYPSGLPVFVTDGHGYEDKSTAQTMNVEAGPAEVRQAVTLAPTLFNVRGVYTATQLALFEGWFRHMLIDGVEWFTVPLDVGRGLVTQEAQFFGGKFTVSRWGQYRVVNATLRVMGRAIMTETEYNQEVAN